MTLSYPTPGMTRNDGPAPDGFRELVARTPLGHGPAALEAAGAAVLHWGAHRGAGFTVRTKAPFAAPGVRVTVGVGPLRAPCEVVWTVHERDRIGFAYGTLPGHPQCGEEAFVVERSADGAVTFTVRALSRPAAWYARAAGPLGRAAQRWIARRYGRAVRRALDGTQGRPKR
ncbi:DUF1990 family protein [Streptomyces xiamenensis]|uniref:DUF1990 family protein n=1 Tax=Streptomyces xiamenensis TaxID=408015 RepID=UPI003D7197A0